MAELVSAWYSWLSRAARFGEAFRAYAARTPAFLPTSRRFRAEAAGR